MNVIIEKKVVNALEVLNEPIEYNKSFSRGLRVDLKEIIMLFISGTASVGANGETVHVGDFSAQVKRTFDNLTALLQSENATWHDVVKTGCFLKEMNYYDDFNIIRNEFYKGMQLKSFPASFCVETNLCRSDLLVEIELTAIIKVHN